MTTTTKQYALETSWSTRITDDIVLKSIKGELPIKMECNILQNIKELNRGKVNNRNISTKLFSFILKDRTAVPIQATAGQLGHIAGISHSEKAFKWGVLLLKTCKDAGLYTLILINEEWYVHPNFSLNKKIRQQIDKLQYLPPMKIVPNDWTTNHNGGWVWENKHLILGNKFNKHNKPLSYDVINKLQSIPWQIDSDTYLFEKQTNLKMDKKKFLRVIDEYLGNPFYFVWRYDSRGRSYSSGYDLNLQTNEYGKALLSLYKEEKITNLSNLYIAIANHAGKDKLTWKQRQIWAKQFIQLKPDQMTWKEPILGRKALRALKDTKEGKSTGYVMSIDATSSGIQIMAVISGCKQTAKLVNCINPHNRYDVYTEVADLMNKQLSKTISRKVAKQITMTHFYNSKATPKALLSKDELAVFYKVITGLLPGAEEVMKVINACWNSTKDHHTWVMPDGHTVYVPVVKGIDTMYSDSELGDIPFRYNHQTSSTNFRSLCPNVIHSIDGYIAREMIRKSNFQLSHIHDCFVFSPDHLQKVTTMYREIMARIAKSNIFEDILQQITNNPSLKVNKFSNDLDQDILNSSYMLS